ncbi:LysM peptidoglycan-binding domain-containing protein [Flavobacterium frigidarium]|uniref:LysM peptidoglycan-binding domain-containing protein n=1 Tax=Flavobacterium frigidarium TaxID=99286 RepID=A0ABV4KBF5_9FLAO
MKNAKFALLFFVSMPLFSQQLDVDKAITTPETNISYLDSIKNTFVKDNMARCVDSLWMNELANLDLFSELSVDMADVDMDVKVEYDLLPTSLLKERLKEMNAKSPFRIEYNESLENVIKSYLKYRKGSFGKIMALSQYYFPMFEEAFAKENVPLEIKFLAVVESTLNPKAVSRMGATGLWQFMYQTGKQYDLKIDSYIDERSDPLKATAAAAKYMSNMYAIFGDWELVLASYNSGPGNVSKAIRRSGGKQNYWNIRKKLPKETQGYVPAFLATMYLYEYHKEHGIIPEKAIAQHFATDTVMVKKQLSFNQISELLDVPVAQLQTLNPSYKLDVIPHYTDENHYLRLPTSKIAVFASNEDKIYAYADHQENLKERPFTNSRLASSNSTKESTSTVLKKSNTYYKVRRGDNLGAIAKKYRVSVKQIKSWNRLRSNTIASGKRLKIVKTTRVAVASKKPAKPKAVVVKQQDEAVVTTDEKASLYTVKKGDNISTIAEKHEVTVADIQKWNGITTKVVKVGETLQIASVANKNKNDIVSLAEVVAIKYTVLKGDVLGTISKKFGTSVVDLKKWNNLNSNTIAVGSRLIVAKGETSIKTNNAAVSTFTKDKNSKQHDYYVKRGDSLYSIAKKYPGVSIADLKKWNDIRGEAIKPGMKLKING